MRSLLQHPFMARALPPTVAIGLSFVVGLVFIGAIGQNPVEVVGKTAAAFFRDPKAIVQNVGYILAEATPLIFAGLSVALAFQAGLVNIGAQGQIVVGCFLCAWVGFTFTALPGWLLVPACVLAAAIGGGLWGAIPGALKAYRGSHEVIITIMMNFIAVATTQYLVNVHYKEVGRQIPQTVQIVEAARLPRMSVILDAVGMSFPAHIYLGGSLFFALGMAVLVWLLLWHTRYGYELRAVGQNAPAAEYGGIAVKANIVLALGLAGALAGMVALDFVMGYKYRFHQDDAVGYGMKGFLGLAVAILGNNHPAGVILAAILFGLISRLGFVMNFENSAVPKDLILILQGLIILCLIVANEWFRRLLLRLKAPAAAAPKA